MENKNQETGKSKQALEILDAIVKWWDQWNNSSNPTDMEDPPIENARKLLASKK